MGIWDVFYWTTDEVRKNAPDISPVTNACQSSYNLGWAAVGKINDAVRRGGALNAAKYMPDSEGWEKIRRIATNGTIYAVDAAVDESLKAVPGGGLISRIYRDVRKNEPLSINGSKNSENLSGKIGEMQKMIEKTQEQMNEISIENKILRDRIKGLESRNKTFYFESNGVQKPEDVISLLTMKGFQSCYFLGPPMVPKAPDMKDT